MTARPAPHGWGRFRPYLLCLLGMALLDCSEPDAFAEAEAAYSRSDFPKARDLYRRALRNPDDATPDHRVKARLGLALRKLRQHDEAERVLGEAIVEAERAGDGLVAARARRYLGRLLVEEHRFDAAREAFDAALAWHQAHGPDADLLKLQIQRAALAWEQGDYEAAWRAYLDVHGRALVARDTLMEAAGLEGISLLLAFVGDLEAARTRIERASELYEREGRRDQAVAARVNAAVIAVTAGQTRRARQLAERSLAEAAETGNKFITLQARLVLAKAHLHDDEPLKASALAAEVAAEADRLEVEALYLEALELATLAQGEAGRWDAFERSAAALEARGKLRPETAPRLDTVRARAALARNDVEPARAHLVRAVEGYEALRLGRRDLPLHGFFLPDRVWAYEALIKLLVDAGEPRAALGYVAKAKARAWTEKLVAAVQSDDVGDRRRLERGVNVLSLVGRAGSSRSTSTEPPADLAVIEYFALPDRLLIFTTRGGRVRAQSRPVSRAELDAKVRAWIATARKGAVDDAKLGAWLGARLLDPAAAAFEGAQAIALVPHGPLHHLPFEALPWSGGLLVDAFPVFSAPSLPALLALMGRPAPKPATSVLAVGDPFANLPGARQEVSEVARRFPQSATRLVGPEAREARVRAAMPGAEVLHFAVHGIRPVPGQPAYLELRPDSQHDGHLHADEIANSRLEARLVVLSVCDSARGEANKGDEIVDVVDRAFLEAGARTVVASRWPVHDAASVLFMQRFYGALLEGASALEAFHRAQLALRRGEALPAQLGEALALLDGSRVRGVRPPDGPAFDDFTHPYFWAAFSLRGDPR